MLLPALAAAWSSSVVRRVVYCNWQFVIRHFQITSYALSVTCLQCFDVVGWAAGRASGHTAQLMPLPLTVSCSSKIQIGFTFLVPAHLGRPGQRAVKQVCVSNCI